MLKNLADMSTEDQNTELRRRIIAARSNVFGIGGPCNDNVLNFNADQRKWIAGLMDKVLGDLSELDCEDFVDA